MGLAPTPGARRAAGPEREPTFTIVIGEQRYPVWFSEASARDVNDLRQGGYGDGLMKLQQRMAEGNMDLPDVAALVWLSRRQTGEPRLSFQMVLPTITYEDEFTLEYDDEVIPDDDAKALTEPLAPEG